MYILEGRNLFLLAYIGEKKSSVTPGYVYEIRVLVTKPRFLFKNFREVLW